MKKPVSLSIVITAYNEEKNIKKLLEQLLKQNLEKQLRYKIYVLSDNSSDNTNIIVGKMKNLYVSLIINKKRIGKAALLNSVFPKIKSDLLVVLDADIQIRSSLFIKTIVQFYRLHPNVDLMGVHVESTEGKGLFEKIISISHSLKNAMYETTSDNVYLCHGRARVFTKKLYKTLIIPTDVPEDAFSYLFCKNLRMKFAYIKSAIIYFRSPDNFSDHIKQSIRFQEGKKNLLKYFTSKQIDIAYSLNTKKKILVLLYFFIKYPFYIFSYISFSLLTNIYNHLKHPTMSQDVWDVSLSSKNYDK